MFYEVIDGKDHCQVYLTQTELPSLDRGQKQMQTLTIAVLRRHPGFLGQHMLLGFSWQNVKVGDQNDKIEGEDKALRRAIRKAKLLWRLSKGVERRIWKLWMDYNQLPIPEKLLDLVIEDMSSGQVAS